MSENKFEPNLLVFACNWCSYVGADLAGVSRIQYPPNTRLVRVMCSGRVDPIYVIEAFLYGSDGVLVTGCHPGDCHYLDSNLVGEARMKYLRRCLEKIGLEPQRLKLEWISASEGGKFANVVAKMVEELKDLGSIQLKKGDV